MRWILAVLIGVVACTAERPMQPPRTRDARAELLAVKPGEHRPQPWMFACYTIDLIGPSKTGSIPAALRLKSDVVNPESPAGLRRYLAEGYHTEPVRGEWWLMTSNKARIGLGVPYQHPGWSLDVTLSPLGGKGSLVYIANTGAGESVAIYLAKVACR